MPHCAWASSASCSLAEEKAPAIGRGKVRARPNTSERKSRVTLPGLSFGRMARRRPPATIVVRITKKFLGYGERANRVACARKSKDGARAQSSNFPARLCLESTSSLLAGGPKEKSWPQFLRRPHGSKKKS